LGILSAVPLHCITLKFLILYFDSANVLECLGGTAIAFALSRLVLLKELDLR
jgi:hypothetical protein